MELVRILAIVALVNGGVWGLFFWQRARLMERTRVAIERSGESWVIPPEKSFYQTYRGFVSVKTMGGAGLTNDSIIFIPPLGRNMIFPLKDIVDLSENTWFAGSYRNGRAFIIMKLADGREIGIQVSNEQLWMQEIRARMRPPV